MTTKTQKKKLRDKSLITQTHTVIQYALGYIREEDQYRRFDKASL